MNPASPEPPGTPPPDEEPTLTTDDVARIFRVAPRTVNQWANDGKLTNSRRTRAGHRRFYPSEIEQRLNGPPPGR